MTTRTAATQRKTWGDFYSGAGGVDYFLDHLAIHKDFIKAILDEKPRRALEAGCGSAIMSVFLAMTGVHVTACDRDDQVLASGAETAKRWNAAVEFVNADLMDLSRFSRGAFDVAFSQGVTEHMNDEQIRKTTEQILNVANTYIFSVPSHWYRHRDFGDERLLSKAEWARILKDLGRVTLTEYYPRRTKKNFLIQKPLMLMAKITR